ncbi:hypothetical protein [Chitinophaga agri]|nr:hypothetical protein [Chitinophaga agri]
MIGNWRHHFTFEIGSKPGPKVNDVIDKIYAKMGYGIIFGGRHAQ